MLLAVSETDARPSSEAARTCRPASCPGGPSQATRKGGSNAHPEGHRAHARMCASGRDRSRQNQCHFTPAWVRARNGAPACEIFRRRRRRTALRRAAERLHVAQPAVSEQVRKLEQELGSSSSTATSAALSSPSGASPRSRRRGTCSGTPKSCSRPRAMLATWATMRLRIGYLPASLPASVPRALRRLAGSAPRVDVDLTTGPPSDSSTKSVSGGSTLSSPVCLHR